MLLSRFQFLSIRHVQDDMQHLVNHLLRVPELLQFVSNQDGLLLIAAAILLGLDSYQ